MKGARWLFADPPNCAVFSVRDIVFRDRPILFVSHDDDGDWQFLTGERVREKDATVVSLGEIVELDRTLLELADLPSGWIATRPSANSSWKRKARQ